MNTAYQNNKPSFLLFGHDTIECACYLAPISAAALDFAQLAAKKEDMRLTGSREPKPIQLGSEEFLLASHGTGSGYPFLLDNGAFSVQCGEFNKPNFFVTFRSFALWQYGAAPLNQRFLTWAESVGMRPYRPAHLSRVDFTFDYALPDLDFDEDSFVSAAAKDNQHRKNGRIQTFRLGEGELLLRVYDKCAEIAEKSAKTWFFDIWGQDHDVWRIEWQVRKDRLRTIGIRTFDDLLERQGDLLRVLVNDHTTLRTKTSDSNRSRWPLHPLWRDLQARVAELGGLGVVKELDAAKLLDERLTRLAVSVYGYMKRIGAIEGLRKGRAEIGLEEAFRVLRWKIDTLHDPLSWEIDVDKRLTQMRLGQW